MNKVSGFTWKLGMFVIIGLVLFAGAIYYVGKQKNLFGSTFHLKAQFKTVSGLKEGNNVRFSGINVGTIDNIELITDTSVMVDLVMKKSVQQFIKTDARASIASDGLMGDKVLTISPGISTGDIATNPVKNNDLIVSKNSVEMEDIMSSVKVSVDNAAIITGQLALFSYKMNNGNGALSKLISDKGFSSSLQGTLTNLQASTQQFAKFTTKLNDGTLDSTMANLKTGTKGLSDNMEAAQHSFLLKGFFKKKKKAEAKKLNELNKKNGVAPAITDVKDSSNR